MKKNLTLFIILSLLTGCSLYNVSSEEVTSNYYPQKPITDVAYREAVSESHEIIGFITVNAERRQKMGEVIEKMKKEAAVLGGDAITNITSNATGTWKKVPPQKLFKNGYVRANFTGTVIAYK